MTAPHLAFVGALAAQHMARARELGRTRRGCTCGHRLSREGDPARRAAAADTVAVWFAGCA